MKTRTALSTLALLFAGAVVSYAQGPMIGTWKLNEAKSHIPAGAPKNTTVVYEMQGDSLKVTTDGPGDGQPVHSEWVGKIDSKDYPVTGNATESTRAYTRINDRSVAMVNKKDGKVLSRGRVVVSADGKTRTVTIHGVSADAMPWTETAIYEKQ